MSDFIRENKRKKSAINVWRKKQNTNFRVFLKENMGVKNQNINLIMNLLTLLGKESERSSHQCLRRNWRSSLMGVTEGERPFIISQNYAISFIQLLYYLFITKSIKLQLFLSLRITPFQFDRSSCTIAFVTSI